MKRGIVERTAVQDEIVRGLTAAQKYISSKYFYDAKGSLLFEEITRLEEYYPTRSEKEVLHRIAPGLIERYRGYNLVELGSGDPSKISILLNEAFKMNGKGLRYVPLDISEAAIRQSTEALALSFPGLKIEGQVLDFTTRPESISMDKPTITCFFGGTIGNFDASTGSELLNGIARNMKPGDVLLLGLDLVKEEAILHAAYNDSRGVTAAFNRNILDVVNNLIHSDFDAAAFEHLAFYNHARGRIEMHLVAAKDMQVLSPFFEQNLYLHKGGSIHTENSHKYSEQQVSELVRNNSLKLIQSHVDQKGWFALVEFQKF